MADYIGKMNQPCGCKLKDLRFFRMIRRPSDQFFQNFSKYTGFFGAQTDEQLTSG